MRRNFKDPLYSKWRKQVYKRDNFTCQYCNNKFPTTKLTYDHVIPKSLWTLNTSPTCWTNIVTACIQCNFKKSNKTPTQADMPLQKEPFIHIDNDVFIWDKFPEKLFESDFFFQEIEFFHQGGRDFYLKGLELYKDALPKEIKVSDGAFNCGVFACVNQKALSLMERYYDYGIEFVKKTENIVNLHVEEVSKRWLAPVIIEQVFIYSLVIFGDYKYDYILYNGFDKKHEMKYSHTIAHHKRHPVVVNMIRERVLLKNWY